MPTSAGPSAMLLVWCQSCLSCQSDMLKWFAEAKFLARQAAEKLLAWEMHTSRPADQTDQSVGM